MNTLFDASGLRLQNLAIFCKLTSAMVSQLATAHPLETIALYASDPYQETHSDIKEEDIAALLSVKTLKHAFLALPQSVSTERLGACVEGDANDSQLNLLVLITTTNRGDFKEPTAERRQLALMLKERFRNCAVFEDMKECPNFGRKNGCREDPYCKLCVPCKQKIWKISNRSCCILEMLREYSGNPIRTQEDSDDWEATGNAASD